MEPTTVIARMPINYADIGENALTEKGLEIYNGLIIDQLPADVEWCGNELIGIYGKCYDLDVGSILENAFNQIIQMDDPELFEFE